MTTWTTDELARIDADLYVRSVNGPTPPGTAAPARAPRAASRPAAARKT